MSQGLPQIRHDIERNASRLPLASSLDEALELAIKAAESSLKTLSLITDPAEKTKCRALAKEYMREAERIKRSPNWRPTVESAGTVQSSNDAPTLAKGLRLLNEPQNSRKLATREEIILEKAGFLNGLRFPRWKAVPAAHEFDIKHGEELFLPTSDEASELPLSDFQLDVLDDWKRPAGALPPPSWFPGDRRDLGPTMSSNREADLVQDAATDCSVVASLCASEARARRGHAKLAALFFHPYDHVAQQPAISKSGKYILRLNFNGTYRKVVIDDRIPTSATERVIHVMDRNNPGLLWPALVEKAYLKVRGGYDFPGSNSGTDLWILTGWVPEQVFLQSDELEPDRFWQRISNAFSYGDVLITMGTGKMSERTEQEICLAGEHDYAVLDLREVDGQRLMLIKNPWVEGISWRGRFKAVPQTDRSSEQSLLIQLEDDSTPVSSPRDLLNADKQLKPGTFWMDLDNVMQYFESIYLNWNTGLFSFRQDVHFAWDLTDPTQFDGIKKTRGPHASLQHTPQFTITAAKSGYIWILLWRHFQNAVPEDATAEQIESGRQDIDLNGHIALGAFASNGRRVMLPERHLQKTWFVDSPQTLLKLEDCEAGKPYTIVPLEQSLTATKQTFTISAFGNAPLTLAEATPRYAYTSLLSTSWSKETAGGNAQNATYSVNPQFMIAVTKKTNMSLLVEASDPKLNVHVKLLHSNGQRAYRTRSRDIIVDSKDYRPGCCLAELNDLDPGQYTIICSTFEAQQLSDLTLLIESSEPVRANLLPREGAGRIRTELSTAAFESGMCRTAAPLVPRRLVNLYAIARHLDQPSAGGRHVDRSHVRLSIELGTGPERQVLIASNGGEFVDSVGAVRTDEIDVYPGFGRRGHVDCWLVLDRMYVSEEAQEEKFAVELFTDQPDAIQCGAWRPWKE